MNIRQMCACVGGNFQTQEQQGTGQGRERGDLKRKGKK